MGRHISRFARGAIMILKQMNYSLGESKDILQELGFELDRIQVKYVRLYTLRSQNAIKHKIYLEQKSRGEQLDEETKRKIIEMFSQNNAKSVKKAAVELNTEAKFITAYLKSQNVLIKNNSIKEQSKHFNKKYALENIKNNILSLFDQEPECVIIKYLHKIRKTCIIRILFPKIKFGQIRQFERYFISFTSEVKYSSIKFLGFEEGERFFGRGSFIYIRAIYDPLIFISFTFLEKFLLRDIPEKFFSSNPVIEVCRLKILDDNYKIEVKSSDQKQNLSSEQSQNLDNQGQQNYINDEQKLKLKQEESN